MKTSYLKYGTIVLFAFIISITSCKNTNRSELANSVNDNIGETTIDVKKSGTNDLEEGNKIDEMNPELNTPDQVVINYYKWRYKIWGKKDIADEELFNIGLFTPDFLEEHPRIRALGCAFCFGDVFQALLIKKPEIDGATAEVSTLICWTKKDNNDTFEENDILREIDCNCNYKTENPIKIKLWKINGKWLINSIN